MRVAVTARHCRVSSELRTLARTRVERLARIASRSHDAQIVFGGDHGVATVELRLHSARGRVVVGRGVGVEHRTALDRAVARVRRQLDKTPARRRTTDRRSTAPKTR
jgi:ribosome-associated translation inhibitor RaiA